MITGIDFSKAYDSVRREKLIETMMHYKFDPNVINAVAEIYKGDKVRISFVGREIKEEIGPTSGIRQGCTLSASLFKLITYRIIKELDQSMEGF